MRRGVPEECDYDVFGELNERSEVQLVRLTFVCGRNMEQNCAAKPSLGTRIGLLNKEQGSLSQCRQG